jgi:hypothetical protein
MGRCKMNSHLSSALELQAQLNAAREKIRKLEARIKELELRSDMSRNRNDWDLVNGNQP